MTEIAVKPHTVTFPTRSVFATYLNADGTPKYGYVEFTLVTDVNLSNTAIVQIDTIRADLDINGRIDAELLVSDDPLVQPQGLMWCVEEKMENGNTWYIKIPTGDGSPVDLTTVFIPGAVPPAYGIQGLPGPVGPSGPGNTLTVNSTTTTAPGTNADVDISGTSPSQALDFYIPRGDKGDIGPQGPQGITGNTGATGATGPQGPQGIQGDTGPQGSTGATGAQGPKGDTGNTGAQGPQGIKGDTGSVGPSGPKGDQGDPGPTGATGSVGPQGPQGIQGNPGQGIIPGGTTGQVLAKKTGADYDMQWSAPATGGASPADVAPPAIGAVGAVGVETDYAREDHTHAAMFTLSGSAPTTIRPDDVAATGSGTTAARTNHTHGIVTDAPTTALSAATTNAEGTGTSFARNDHSHAITANVAASALGAAAAVGTSAALARADHVHPYPTAANVGAEPLGSVATHAATPGHELLSSTTPAALGTPAVGVGTTTARADHVHAMPTAVQVGALDQTTADGLYLKRVVTVMATATITAAAAVKTDYVYAATVANSVITLPTAVGNTNRYTLKHKVLTGEVVTVNTTAGQTIDGVTSFTLDYLYTSIDLVSDGANWMII